MERKFEIGKKYWTVGGKEITCVSITCDYQANFDDGFWRQAFDFKLQNGRIIPMGNLGMYKAKSLDNIDMERSFPAMYEHEQMGLFE